jgi:hypothetical protein
MYLYDNCDLSVVGMCRRFDVEVHLLPGWYIYTYPGLSSLVKTEVLTTHCFTRVTGHTCATVIAMRPYPQASQHMKYKLYEYNMYTGYHIFPIGGERYKGINGDVQRLLHSSSLILLSSRMSRQVGLLSPDYDHSRPIYTVIMQIQFQKLRNISGG